MPRYTTGAAVGVFGINTALGCGVGEKVGNVGWSVGGVGDDRTANTLETIVIIKKRYTIVEKLSLLSHLRVLVS